MGSDAISAVPVRAKTRSISGNLAFSVASSCCCIATDCERLVPGMRSAWMAKSPSFRLGTNSLPMRVAIRPHSTTATAAAASITALAAITRSSSGPYQRLACTTRKFSVSLTRWPMNRATAAGMKVTDRIMAPTSAATTVNAIGWNIFPSTPVRAKMGKYTTMMMSCPNSSARRDSLDARNTS